MLYLSLFCLNLSYKSLDVHNSGGGVVPNSDVYKYSDPELTTPALPTSCRALSLFFPISSFFVAPANCFFSLQFGKANRRGK